MHYQSITPPDCRRWTPLERVYKFMTTGLKILNSFWIRYSRQTTNTSIQKQLIRFDRKRGGGGRGRDAGERLATRQRRSLRRNIINCAPFESHLVRIDGATEPIYGSILKALHKTACERSAREVINLWRQPCSSIYTFAPRTNKQSQRHMNGWILGFTNAFCLSIC